MHNDLTEHCFDSARTACLKAIAVGNLAAARDQLKTIEYVSRYAADKVLREEADQTAAEMHYRIQAAGECPATYRLFCLFEPPRIKRRSRKPARTSQNPLGFSGARAAA